jgi:hypothetical protein
MLILHDFRAIVVITALAIHLGELRSATTSDSRQSHVNRFNICLMVLSGLRDIYWVAEQYVVFFEESNTGIMVGQNETKHARDVEISSSHRQKKYLPMTDNTTSFIRTGPAPSSPVTPNRSLGDSRTVDADWPVTCRGGAEISIPREMTPWQGLDFTTDMQTTNFGFDEWLLQFQINRSDFESVLSV